MKRVSNGSNMSQNLHLNKLVFVLALLTITLSLSAKTLNNDSLLSILQNASCLEQEFIGITHVKSTYYKVVKPDYFFSKKNETELQDTLFTLKQKYQASQRFERKRISHDGKSSGWDAIHFNYNLEIKKDSTFLLEKSSNNFSTTEFGNWYCYGNYLLLQIKGTKIGKEITYNNEIQFKKISIFSNSLLYYHKDDLAFKEK